jgi:antitoxin CcdA
MVGTPTGCWTFYSICAFTMRMNDARARPKGQSRKRATNLTIDADLLARAKALGLNVSSVLDESLRARIREEEARRWLEENKEAFDAFNRETRDHGVWSERLRRF